MGQRGLVETIGEGERKVRGGQKCRGAEPQSSENFHLVPLLYYMK